MLELRTLGEVGLLAKGVRVRLGTRKQYGLLAYLAINQGVAFQREHLVTLLWTDSSPSRGRHSLSQALYGIRARLPELQVEAGIDTLSIVTGAIAVDLLELRRAVASGSAQHVLDLYRGPFLEGYFVDGAEGFEWWHEGIRTEVAADVTRACQRLLEDAEREHNWLAARQLAERLLALDHLDERTHRSRIRAIAAAGAPGRALAEFRKLEQMVLKELGKQLEAETSLVGQHLMVNSLNIRGVAESAANDEPRYLPFVGREAEFQQMRHLWEEVKSGTTRVALVSGEAGIGKTRFCYQFLRLAALQGARILQGRCYSSESRLAYAGFVDALTTGLKPADLLRLPPVWASVIAHFAPELSPWDGDPRALPPLAEEGAQRRLFEAVVRLLHTISASAPTVLFLDDFHWADDATAAITHYIVRRSPNRLLFLVLAVRPEDLQQGTTLADFLASLKEGSHTHEVQLEQLQPETGERFIEAFSRREQLAIGTALRHHILDRAGGHPLFLLEMLKALPDSSSALIEGVEPPQLHSQALSVPPTLEAFFHLRFALLSAPASAAMSALAIVQRTASLAVLRSLAGLSEEGFATALPELLKKRLIRESDGAIEFSHDLVREAAYQFIGASERRMLHRNAGTLLCDDPDIPPGIVAGHFDLARVRAGAWKYALLAAAESEKLFAHREAEFFLRMALSNAAIDNDRTAVQRRLADSLFRSGRLSEADQLYQRAERYFDQNGLLAEAIAIRIKRAEVHAKLGALSPDELIQALDSLGHEARLNEAKDPYLLSLFLRAEIAHNAGRTDELLKMLPDLAEPDHGEPPTISEIQCLTLAAGVTSTFIDPDKGADCAALAYQRAEKSGVQEHLLIAKRARGTAELNRGNIVKAILAFRETIQIADRLGAVTQRAYTLNNLGVALLEQGSYAEAKQIYAEAIAVSGELGLVANIMFPYSNMALLALVTGAHADLRTYCGELLRCADKMPSWWCSVVTSSLLGLSALSLGRVEEARRYGGEVLRLTQGRPRWVESSHPEILLARLEVLKGNRVQALTRLDAAIVALGRCEPFTRARLELEKARQLSGAESYVARQLAGEVRIRADAMGARPIVAEAEAILDALPHP